MREVEGDIEFMLRRTVSICLTDPKAPLSRGKCVGVSPMPLGATASLPIFYWPLLTLMHTLRMMEPFRREVLTFVHLAIECTSEGACVSVNEIDWDLTRRNLRTGERRILCRQKEAVWSDDDGRLAALVLCEYRCHCRLWLNMYEMQRLLPQNVFLHQTLKLLDRRT